ncbi:MAG: SEC-C metal-binding domain-containing protein [bacterium]
MKILRYNNLDVTGLKAPFDRTVAMLAEGNFRGADVRKMGAGGYYRAKLSDADRLLFRFASCGGETYLVLLEVIRNHAYESSRFLRGAVLDESKLVPLELAAPADPADVLPLNYVNPAVPRVHVLDKILSFDELQEDALHLHPPLILIGSAGSGKTVLTLEKLRQLPGEVLYVTLSPYLTENARTLYYSHHYENRGQEVSFLSFLEFVQSIGVPVGKPLTFPDFAAWFARYRAISPVKDAHPVYEEFNGVLTGSAVTSAYLSLEEYQALGVRRSIFPVEERPAVYELFRRYLSFLETAGHYDLNLVCFNHQALCHPAYDFVVADEVQDLTAVQLSLILRSLRNPAQFVLCGDSNQIVHPNFFSWAAVKSFFYEQRLQGRGEIIRILNTNYRNSPEVTAIANRLLLIKNARFGSIDRESHYLVRPVSSNVGRVEFLQDSAAVRREIDEKTGRSARFAVVVMREEDKADARRVFRTPLVFSVQEAKGLEYENIILLNFVTSNARAFDVLTEDVMPEDLAGDFSYARARDKGDKSLEAYKFFVNALYVAITRAVRNLFILEQNPSHRLLTLLALGPSRAAAGLETQQSTVDEWKVEARRLEQQGKTEQVDAIRQNILHTQSVPWKVYTPENIGELAQVALAPASGDKPRRLLLDYAVSYSVRPLLAELGRFGFKPGERLDLVRATALQRHSVDYREYGQRELRRKIDQYGIDFRNPLNQTPLMIATQLGMVALASELIQKGAGTERCDNWGRNPLQLALRAAYHDPAYAKRSLGELYPLLAPPALRVRVGGRLHKIDNHRAEFFILQSMIAMQERILREKIDYSLPAFETEDFIHALVHFPDHVIPSWRRQRHAISSVLAGHEVYRNEPRNRRLFVRVIRGRYILNPCMEFDLDGNWVRVPDLLHLEVLEQEDDNRRLVLFLETVRKVERNVERLLAAHAGTTAPAAVVRGDPVPVSVSDASVPASGKMEPAPGGEADDTAAGSTKLTLRKLRAMRKNRDLLLQPGQLSFPPGATASPTRSKNLSMMDRLKASLRRNQVAAQSDCAVGADAPPPPPATRFSVPPNGAVSRSAPCPCGSGRKYKRCCGKG